MSKSLDNYIAIEDEPGDMYGKVMSLSDDTMWTYWQLCTQRTEQQIAAMKGQVAQGELHPKAAKQELARAIVGDYHGEGAAQAAQSEFDNVFAAGKLPTDMPTVTIDGDEPVWIVTVITACEFAKSNGEARRLIKQGAVSLDGDRVTDDQATVAADGAERVLKVGKRRFAKVTVGP
jgi:tyrosyl-tRNA synthetase